MENTKVKRTTSVAERFRGQMDLLTGDKKPISGLHQPLIPVPRTKLTKSQIMSLYD